MNSSNFILLLIAALLFFAGTFGHRFDRHTTTTTKNGIIENEKIGEGIRLLSDDKEAPTVSDGENVTLTGRGNAQLQLTNGELIFEFCTRNCMGETITACYDAVDPKTSLQGSCLSNQCELQAIVTIFNKKDMLAFNNHQRLFNSDICESVLMRSPDAVVSFRTTTLESCDPLLSDGNVVNLYVSGASSSCYLKVLNAKKWIPATTPAPSNSTSESQCASTEEKEDSSSALMPLWIVLGIFLFVLVAAVIIIGIWCWCKQKKSSAAPVVGNDGKANPGLTENKTKTDGGNAIEETVAKTEASKPKKVADAKEKKEIVEQSKPADALADVGVNFDHNMEIESMPEEAVNYLRRPTTPEFVRSYAFGSLFRKLIDDHAPGNKIYSVPLLFAILLQQRYSIQNRREIAVFIRRELLIIDDEFSLKERSASAFPVNAIEFAVQHDEMRFRNIASFLKRSGLGVASGKGGKKNSGGGKKKKRSKK